MALEPALVSPRASRRQLAEQHCAVLDDDQCGDDEQPADRQVGVCVGADKGECAVLPAAGQEQVVMQDVVMQQGHEDQGGADRNGGGGSRNMPRGSNDAFRDRYDEKSGDIYSVT